MTEHKSGQFCYDRCAVCNDGDHTYWVTIGRNTNTGGELSDFDWLNFQSRIRTVVHQQGGVILSEIAGGFSTWNGVPEQTHAILATVPAPTTIRYWLQVAAHAYHQDAIGIVGGPGTDTLVSGS